MTTDDHTGEAYRKHLLRLGFGLLFIVTGLGSIAVVGYLYHLYPAAFMEFVTVLFALVFILLASYWMGLQLEEGCEDV